MKGIWQKAVFSLIGEAFPNPETVTGVRIVDRGKMFKIEVWVRFNSDPAKTELMKQKIMKEFELEKIDSVEIAQHMQRYNKLTG